MAGTERKGAGGGNGAGRIRVGNPECAGFNVSQSKENGIQCSFTNKVFRDQDIIAFEQAAEAAGDVNFRVLGPMGEVLKNLQFKKDGMSLEEVIKIVYPGAVGIRVDDKLTIEDV